MKKLMKKVQAFGKFLYFKVVVPAVYTALGTVLGMLVLQYLI